MLFVDVPPRFESARFESLGWITKRNPKAIEACMKYATNFRDKKARPPILVGPSGTGKTHLLYAIARAIEKGFQGETAGVVRAEEEKTKKAIDTDGFYAARELSFKRIEIQITSGVEIAHAVRQSVTKGNLDGVVDGFRQAEFVKGGYYPPLLFVDDLEVMKMGDWLNEELYRIFDYRYAHMLPTVMATNLGAEELRKHLGDRITRRLFDMADPVVMR